jgi:hypothetical protein
MLWGAVMMESPKIVASLLRGKGNPNDAKGFQARKSVFLVINTHPNTSRR